MWSKQHLLRRYVYDHTGTADRGRKAVRLRPQAARYVSRQDRARAGLRAGNSTQMVALQKRCETPPTSRASSNGHLEYIPGEDTGGGRLSQAHTSTLGTSERQVGNEAPDAPRSGRVAKQCTSFSTVQGRMSRSGAAASKTPLPRESAAEGELSARALANRREGSRACRRP